MTERFLTYSLERKKKISVILLKEEKMEKKNILVTSLDRSTGNFTAIVSGKKQEVQFHTEEVLTADYARGDHGELE